MFKHVHNAKIQNTMKLKNLPSIFPLSRNLSVRRIKTVFTSRQDKPRRLWRLAIAPQPPIAGHQSAACPEGTRIYQKPTASSEGAQLWDRHPLTLSWFRKAGQTIILNIIGDASVPLRGTHFWGYHIYPQLRCFAACSGFSLYRSRSAEPAAQTQSAGRSWVRGYGETP